MDDERLGARKVALGDKHIGAGLEVVEQVDTVGGSTKGRGEENGDTARLDGADDGRHVGSSKIWRTYAENSVQNPNLDRRSQVEEGYIENFFNPRPWPWYSTRAATPGTSSTSSTMASSPFDFVFSRSSEMGVSVSFVTI